MHRPIPVAAVNAAILKALGLLVRACRLVRLPEITAPYDPLMWPDGEPPKLEPAVQALLRRGVVGLGAGHGGTPPPPRGDASPPKLARTLLRALPRKTHLKI